MRQFYLIRNLARRHHLTVISFMRQEEDSELPALQDCGVNIIPIPFSPPAPESGWRNRWLSWRRTIFDPKPHFAQTYPVEQLKHPLQRTLYERKWDVIQFEFLYTAPLSDGIGSHPWLFTAHNVESLNALSQASQVRKPTQRIMAQLEAAKLKHWERSWIERSKACVAVSQMDADRLGQLAPKAKLFVVPNGVDSEAFRPVRYVNRKKNQIVFFGNLGYPPNASGLRWFIEKVFPILKENLPDVSLEILGAYAPQEIREYNQPPGIRFTGFVDDIRPYLWKAVVCIVPLFSGGGTRLKILEAMAAGCAVVSTSTGIEGLELQHGVEFRQADNPTSFSQEIIQLCNDRDLRRKMTEQAMAAVESRYDWGMVAPKLEQIYSMLSST